MFLFSSTFDLLCTHYRNTHYLCEIDECKNVQFTNVFSSELEFRAHQAAKHSKSRAEARQLGTIPVEFQSSSVRDRRQQQRETSNRGKVVALPDWMPHLVASQIQRIMPTIKDKETTIRRETTGRDGFFAQLPIPQCAFVFVVRRINVRVTLLLLRRVLRKSPRSKSSQAWAIGLRHRRVALNNVAPGEVTRSEGSIPTRTFLLWRMERQTTVQRNREGSGEKTSSNQHPTLRKQHRPSKP